MTIGKQFVEVAKGNKVILEEVEESMRRHKEVTLLTFCFEAARKGAFEVKVGKCLPPCLDEEDIFFKKDANNAMIAYWK